MAETITIRRAVAADVPALCILADALVRQHVAYDPDRYRPPADVTAAYTAIFNEHLPGDASVVTVAERRGELLGYVFGFVEAPSLVALTGRVGWIHDLYVAPAARGHGVGGRLLDAAVGTLQSLGCPGGVLLGVAAQNAAAAALFRSRGFRATLQEMTLNAPPGDDT